MAVPARLSRKLRDVFGPEAAEEMMTLVDELRSQGDAAAEFRQQMLAAMQRLEDRIQGVEIRLTERIGDVKVDLSARIGDVKADLMKWSFLFWVGAVAAIAMLAGVLDR